MIGLSGASVLKQLLGSGAEADLLFMPTDWPGQVDPEAFDQADKILRERSATASSFAAHVDGSFGLLVKALMELKHEKAVGPDVFLSVLSTDPSEHLESLENESVSRLNSEALVRDREKFLAKWA